MARILAALALLGALLPAQGPRGPVLRPDPDHPYDPSLRDLGRLVVKFAEGIPVRLRSGRWTGPADLAGANRVLARARSVRRLFLRSEGELDRERAEILARLPAGAEPPADLNNYFQLAAGTEAEGRELLRNLLGIPVVETAFPEHRPDGPWEPGDIPPPTPDYGALQTFRGPAPTGIDHQAARTIPGGRGDGLMVVDVESSWRLNHEDVPQLVQANVIGAHTESLNPNHGVAVIGELAAEWDAYGVTGLVDRVAIRVHSHQRLYWASAVSTAAATAPPGGFVVLEVQLSYNGKIAPMESRQDVFDATRNAVLAGRHVVAAAGNGYNDLDDPFFQGLFDRTKRDSGAILVGATDGANLVRASFSNHGACVDANGWGAAVVTAGYGYLFDPGGDVRQQYTNSFGGTSSATPIVTGAAVALAGAMKEQLGRSPSPAELRDLIRQYGTDVPGGRIGKRPDLRKLLAAAGLPAGLEVTREARLGQSLRVEASGGAGDPFALLLALDRGLIDFGAAGRFLLDPAGTFVLLGGTLPAAGRQGFDLAVPSDRILERTTLFFQAVLVRGGQARLTNSACNFLF